MSENDQEQILFADDSQYINDITHKLAKIRQTLGIDIYEQDEFKTPQSDTANKANDHNTFGKNIPKTSESKVSQAQELPMHQSSNHDLYQSISDNNNNNIDNTILPQQISFLQNKLEALKQIYPCQGQDQASFLERENVYLKIELELKSKQERFLRQQLSTLQEDSVIKLQQITQQLEDYKQQHEDFVNATDLAQDVKQYILAIESDLHLVKNELNLFTQRLSKEQSEKEQLQHQFNQSYNKAREEFQVLYEKTFKELQFMCQALSAELMAEDVNKKSNRIKQQSNFTKLYQDLIDEKFILNNKVDDLENKLESYQNKATNISYAPSIKCVYEKRLNTMKQGLLHWKTRTQQIEHIVLQWIQKLKEENQNLKALLIKKQNKMFNMFESLLREVYQTFQNDKVTLLEHISALQEMRAADGHKMTQMRASLQKKNKSGILKR